MESLVVAALERLVADRPDEGAIFELASGRRLTFRDLAADARSVKEAFDRSIPHERSPLISLAGNRPSWFSIFLASLERGDVLLPLDPDTTWAEAEILAKRYGASAIVGTPSPEAPTRASVELLDGLALYPQPRSTSFDAGHAALLKLTSGTSDESRAVLVSEAHLWNDGRHVVEAMDIRPEDVNYGVIPLSHSYGLGNLVIPLFLQGTKIALCDLFLPGRLQEDVDAARASIFPGVPFHFERILTHFQGARLPPSLRLLLSAGARIDPDLVTSFREGLGMKVHSFYGSSETGGITYDDSEEVAELLHVGKAMPETEVSLRSEDSSTSEGRVFVRGNAVAGGYVEGDEREGPSKFVDGGFLTGDLGRRDELGRLVLTGRVSSFVNVAGRKVNPREVEAVLLEMPGILEAKVLGLPCEQRGQKLVAFVVPRARQLNELDVRTFCAKRLSPHKIPRELVLLDFLPLTGRGKVDRRALEDLAGC